MKTYIFGTEGIIHGYPRRPKGFWDAEPYMEGSFSAINRMDFLSAFGEYYPGAFEFISVVIYKGVVSPGTDSESVEFAICFTGCTNGEIFVRWYRASFDEFIGDNFKNTMHDLLWKFYEFVLLVTFLVRRTKADVWGFLTPWEIRCINFTEDGDPIFFNVEKNVHEYTDGKVEFFFVAKDPSDKNNKMISPIIATF